jgi:hypothetical protein
MSSILRNRRTIVLLAMLTFAIVGCGGGGGGGGNAPPPAPTPPPATTVTLDAASSGSVNRTIQLSATVTAATGVTVTSVEFLVDGTVVGTATTAPYGVNWDTSTVADGAHNITARVTDSLARIVTSSAASYTVTNNPVIHVQLSNDEVLPAVTSDATAEGDITVNLVTGAVSGGIAIQGLTATLAHIHRGYAGVNGPVVVDFAADPANSARWNAVAGGALSADDVDNLLAGALYVNVHSAAHPGGEIRGQLQPENIQVVYSPMSHEQVVPAAPDAASGTVAATIDSGAGTATVHAITSALVEPTETHVHSAAQGENATAPLFALTQTQTDPNHWAAELQPVTAAQIDAFEANLWYVDVHTTGLPNGAVRGQILADMPAPPPPPPAATTLAELQAGIFTPLCSGCHTGNGASLPGVMNLSNADATFSSLVGVPSIQQGTLLRVEANDSANSYLVHKIEGAASITGSRMPLGGAPLDAALIAQVKSWIDAGAVR